MTNNSSLELYLSSLIKFNYAFMDDILKEPLRKINQNWNFIIKIQFTAKLVIKLF